MVYFANSVDKGFKGFTISIITYLLNKTNNDFEPISFSDEVLSNYDLLFNSIIENENKYKNILLTIDASNDYLIDKLLNSGVQLKILWMVRNPISSFLLNKSNDIKSFEITLINQIERMNRYSKLGLVDVMKYEDVLSRKNITVFNNQIQIATIEEVMLSNNNVPLATPIDEMNYFNDIDIVSKETVDLKINEFKNILLEKIENPIQTYIDNEEWSIKQIENYYKNEIFDFNDLSDSYKSLGFNDEFTDSSENRKNMDSIFEKINENFKKIKEHISYLKNNKELNVNYDYNLKDINWDYFKKIAM